MSMNPDLPDFIPRKHPNDTVLIESLVAVDEDKVDLLITANGIHDNTWEVSCATLATTSDAVRKNNTGEHKQPRTFNQQSDSHRGGYTLNTYGHSQDVRKTSQTQQEITGTRGGARGKGDRGWRRGGGRGDRRGGHAKREFESMDFQANYANQAIRLKRPELNPYDEDGVEPEIPGDQGGNQGKHKSHVDGGPGPWNEDQPETEEGGRIRRLIASTSPEWETYQIGTDTDFRMGHTRRTRTDWAQAVEQAKPATDQGPNPAHSSYPTPDSQKPISPGSKRTIPRAANPSTSKAFPIHATNNEDEESHNDEKIEVSLGHLRQNDRPRVDACSDIIRDFNNNVKSDQAIFSDVTYHQWIVGEEFGAHYAQKGMWFKPDQYQHILEDLTINGHRVSGIGTIELQVHRRPSDIGTSTLTLKNVFHLPCAPCNVLDPDLLNHTFRIPRNQKAQAFDQSKAPVWYAHFSNDVARLAFSLSPGSAMLGEVTPLEPTADEKAKLKAFLSTLEYWN